jgi:hypothetical protein
MGYFPRSRQKDYRHGQPRRWFEADDTPLLAEGRGVVPASPECQQCQHPTLSPNDGRKGRKGRKLNFWLLRAGDQGFGLQGLAFANCQIASANCGNCPTHAPRVRNAIPTLRQMCPRRSSEAGEVSPSYVDGEVMIHGSEELDPSVRCAATSPREASIGFTHRVRGPLRPRHRGGRGRGPARLRGEGEVGCGVCKRSIWSLRSTTSPSHCFAMGPALSPATRRRGTLSEMCESDRREAWGGAHELLVRIDQELLAGRALVVGGDVLEIEHLRQRDHLRVVAGERRLQTLHDPLA